jgi:hypothetical protein
MFVAVGSIGVDFDLGADAIGRLLVLVDEFGDALDDDGDADTDEGARFGSRALGTSDGSALPVDVSGVAGPLVTADGAPGEPASSAR